MREAIWLVREEFALTGVFKSAAPGDRAHFIRTCLGGKEISISAQYPVAPHIHTPPWLKRGRLPTACTPISLSSANIAGASPAESTNATAARPDGARNPVGKRAEEFEKFLTPRLDKSARGTCLPAETWPPAFRTRAQT
ncbi:hypothetical protein AAFF_G00005910 [Aldrovandia affinis]|uniref:Uncharacterized protein n=1 Tax=Aldrovandia affinis TaxID=143900 RepID=A0AAD7TEP2_9TELE|nr:hypothetical protein AAFF_G00005910 [Aldrovandia affinis]